MTNFNLKQVRKCKKNVFKASRVVDKLLNVKLRFVYTQVAIACAHMHVCALVLPRYIDIIFIS